ncbi:MAG: OmpA family protein, partial [Pseudomonadota bacterium]
VQFIVYFDYDKSSLTPEAANLVREASARALSNEIETVVVAGNTDTSGSSAYNQALSERRARVVRDALIANGVPADRIETRAFGESNLAKPTPDGTREPLNRRTEVTISFE